MNFKKRKLIFERLLETKPEVQESYDLVLTFFRENKKKSINWFFAKNPMLGEISPIEMILMDKIDRLNQFLRAAKEGE